MAQPLAAQQTMEAQHATHPALCPRCDVPLEADYHRHWCWFAFQVLLFAERPELERVFDEHDGSDHAFHAVLRLADDLRAAFDAWTPHIRKVLRTSMEDADALIAMRLEKVLWYVDRELARQAATRERTAGTAKLRVIRGGAAA